MEMPRLLSKAEMKNTLGARSMARGQCPTSDLYRDYNTCLNCLLSQTIPDDNSDLYTALLENFDQICANNERFTKSMDIIWPF